MDALTTARNNIKKARTEKGFRQQDMADKLNMNLKSYQNLENGETKLDLERLTQVADVLEISVFDLLKSDDVYIHQEIGEKGIGIRAYNDNRTKTNDVDGYRKALENLEKEVEYLRNQNIKLLEMLDRKGT